MNKQETYPKSEQKEDIHTDVIENIPELGIEKNEILANKHEKNEHEKEAKVSHEEALEKASELAKKSDEHKKEDEKSSPEHRVLRGAPSKKQLGQSFNNQIKNIRQELPLSQKIFSGIIHSKPIEATSDFLEKTLARPNALLSGSIAAFLAVTASYFIAKYFGFQLSGFETMGAFIVGWFLGVAYDYFSTLFGKRNR